ncbi:MAG: hypothetical protein BGO23_05300 [Solirubrobacterales bacterium 67-14]|nr:MAG: hypothetical protein BGO23_05300 [Solirubrobacterales bacterium 67-14]
MKVGVGGGVSCEEAHDVITRFFDWYESQPGIAQSRYIDDFRCVRASGSLACQAKPRWIYADSHVGSKPWEWPAPWVKPKPAKPPKGRPFLGRNEARSWMRVALTRHFGANWRYAVNRELKCTKRIRKNRVRCQRIAWANGDLVYWGQGTIWYLRKGWSVEWYYSFRVRRLNEYCAFVLKRPVRKCLKKYVVR